MSGPGEAGASAARLEIWPVTGIGDVAPGADLAALIVGAAPWIADGDVLVVTSKIVSKAEGQLVDVPLNGPEREAAREAVLATQTARPVARRGRTRIVQTHHGFVLATAGIDASNVDRSALVLLPKDPDASARALRSDLRERHGLDVAIVVTDTMGRPWRLGLVDLAIGAAGIDALVDYRGTVDPYGNELRLTQMAVIDELAGAAELVKGKCDQVPVAVIRGVFGAGGLRADDRAGAGGLRADDGAGAAALVRDARADLFSMGTAEALALGRHCAAVLADATAFADTALDPDLVDSALATVGADFSRLSRVPDELRAVLPVGTAVVVVPTVGSADPWAAAQAGATVHRLRAELAGYCLGTAWLPARDGAPLGVLAIGVPAHEPDRHGS